jgi:hypothetical protein
MCLSYDLHPFFLIVPLGETGVEGLRMDWVGVEEMMKGVFPSERGDGWEVWGGGWGEMAEYVMEEG